MKSERGERLPVVGVMGSGTAAGAHAEELGRALAELPVHLLTGGGRGVMAAVSRAFSKVKTRKGIVIGVVPSSSESDTRPPEGYPNDWVEIVVRTHLHQRGIDGSDQLSRNHINILTSDVVIALGGGPGTRSEVNLAVRYKRPVAWYMPERAGELSDRGPVPLLRTLNAVLAFVTAAVSLPTPTDD